MVGRVGRVGGGGGPGLVGPQPSRPAAPQRPAYSGPGPYRPSGTPAPAASSTPASTGLPALPPPPTWTPPARGPTTNTAQLNPDLSWLSDRYKSRFNADTTERAIDRATGGIADSAALLGKDLRANLASRGALGSGVGEAFLRRRVTDPAQRAAAGAAADIAMGGETRLDQLAAGGAGVLGAPAHLALQQAQLAQQQYAQDVAMSMQAHQAQMQQYQAMLSLLQAV